MAMLNRVTLAALALSMVSAPLIHSSTDDATFLPSDQTITADAASTNSANYIITALNQNFFAQPAQISDEIRNIAFATMEMGFIKWTDKDVLFCDYKSYENTVKNSKFTKQLDGSLVPVKSEEYAGAANGSPSFSKCVRKGRTARSSIELQEGAARLLRATTKPEDITQVSLTELYANCIPLCVQAKSVAELREFTAYLQKQLALAAIDPSVRVSELKPLCVVIISSDPLLRTVDDALWNDLKAVFNMTTFYDITVRQYILDMRSSLSDMVKDAKDGADLNPSFLEGLFDDLNKANYDFSYKKIVREILSSVLSIKGLVTMAAGYTAVEYIIKPAAKKTVSLVFGDDTLVPAPAKTK